MGNQVPCALLRAHRRSNLDKENTFTRSYSEREGFRREDISEEAWANRNENIEPFSFWRSKYEAPAPPGPEPLPKDDVESLLRRLIASQDPASANVRYILALMLERKRILRPVESPRRQPARL